MLRKFVARALAALLLVAGAALADEASVKKAFEALPQLKGKKVDGVRKTSQLGLYEIRLGNQLFYTDEKAKYIFDGNIIEAQSGINLTEERMSVITAINFSELPLDLAVKTVRGNGKRILATFEDPNCGYCKVLAKDMQGMDNLTIYTFLLPIIAADSPEKARAVWCSPDRSKAWNDLMTKDVPPAGGNCVPPTEKVKALAIKLNVSATPTIFLSNGERHPGAVPAAKLEEMLKKIAAK
jgi:thiol:disulfide interchange protein DsbC